MFTIGENQPKLFDAADALCWRVIAAEAWTVDRGHGRIDVRTIKTLPPTDADQRPVPARQAGVPRRALQLRHGRDPARRRSRPRHHQPAPGPGRPGDLLAYLRGHWSIEMHHYIRDVCLGEDASRVSRAHQAMAAIRNTVIGILHLHRIPNIAAQLRICHRDPYRLPLQLLGLTKPQAPLTRNHRRDLNATIPPHQNGRLHRTHPGKHRMTSMNTNQPPDPLNK